MPTSKAKAARPTKKDAGNSKAIFEKLLQKAGKLEHYQLRLYVTGATARSVRAIANIRALCEEYLTGNYDLEVVDIYQQPSQAAQEQIIAAPTLVKQFPNPPKRLIGDFSDRDKVIIGLDLNHKRPAGEKPKTSWVKLP